MSDRQSVAGKRHFHGLEGSREYQSRRRCSFSLSHSSISRRSAISVSTAKARAASATLKACWAELSGAVVVGGWSYPADMVPLDGRSPNRSGDTKPTGPMKRIGRPEDWE